MPKRDKRAYGLSEVEIAQFRNMKDVSIQLGQRITLIAGQNGTGKSTILGMLGQPFGMDEEETIFGRSCKTKFADIFKMSPTHDVAGKHLYYLEFRDTSISNGRQHVQVKSFARTQAKSHIRFVTGSSRNRGDGNIDYPVIYLGLKRTFPVGEMPNPQALDSGLKEEEVERFCRWYSRVILPTGGEEIHPVRMSKAGRKDTLLINTGAYDFLANSAGQDNLGQILGALISFQRIKEHMGESYKGGLLLIDELDATLFPASQFALMDILYEISEELCLQTIFTTHSIDLIDYALSYKSSGDDIRVNYLRARSSGVSVDSKPTIDAIRSDLYIEPLPVQKRNKVEVWCEDDEAKWFLRHMMPPRLRQKCNIVSAGLGCGELGELAIRESIPALENVLFVVDADSDKGANQLIQSCPKRFVLPGDEKSPERSVYEMLNSFEDDDVFWELCGRGYSKQIFLKNWSEQNKVLDQDNKRRKRRVEKTWFRKEKRSGVWGDNGCVVFKAWRAQHESEIKQFNEGLERKVDATLRRMAKG